MTAIRFRLLFAAIALCVTTPLGAAEAGKTLLVAQADPIPAPSNLTGWRTQTGAVLQFTVTGEVGGSVWGSGPYTTDSSFPAAAVHAGVVELGETKTVTVEILGPQPGFTASVSNGVNAASWGSYDSAFRFTEAAARDVGMAQPDPGTLSAYGNVVGKTYSFTVTGGTSGSIWGSGPYTTDSSLSHAAVHAGLLQPGETGTVTVEILGPQQSFSGTEQNGVSTSDWGSYGSAFVFVEEQRSVAPSQGEASRAGQALPKAPS